MKRRIIMKMREIKNSVVICQERSFTFGKTLFNELEKIIRSEENKNKGPYELKLERVDWEYVNSGCKVTLHTTMTVQDIPELEPKPKRTTFADRVKNAPLVTDALDETTFKKDPDELRWIEDNTNLWRQDALDALTYALSVASDVDKKRNTTLKEAAVNLTKGLDTGMLRADKELKEKAIDYSKADIKATEAVFNNTPPTVMKIKSYDWLSAVGHYKNLGKLCKTQGYITVEDYHKEFGWTEVGPKDKKFGWYNIDNIFYYDYDNNTVNVNELPRLIIKPLKNPVKDELMVKYIIDVSEDTTGNDNEFIPTITYSTYEAARYFRKKLNRQLFKKGKISLSEYCNITEIGYSVFNKDDDHGWLSKGLDQGFFTYITMEGNWVLCPPSYAKYVELVPKPNADDIITKVCTSERYAITLRGMIDDTIRDDKFISIAMYYDIIGQEYDKTDESLIQWGWEAKISTAYVKPINDCFGRPRYEVRVAGSIVKDPKLVARKTDDGVLPGAKPVYKCDSKRNTKCSKTLCHENGGDCKMTFDEAFSAGRATRDDLANGSKTSSDKVAEYMSFDPFAGVPFMCESKINQPDLFKVLGLTK